MDKRFRLLVAVSVAGLQMLVMASTARAGGFEDTVNGTHALGRGAYYARVRDFMAVWQNPANLAVTPRTNVGLHGRLPIMNACFNREKDPSREYADGDTPFPTVCNKAGPVPTGSLGFSMPIRKDWGFGFGMFAPAAIANLKFGSDTIYTKGVGPGELDDQQVPPTLQGDDVPPPSPGRWMLLERNVLAAFFMAGVGYAPIPQLRIGLSAGFGFANIGYKASSSVDAGDLSAEVLTNISASDAFIPRLVGSVATTPVPGLDISGTFSWTDDIHAKGHADMLANGFAGAQGGADCRTPPDPGGDGLLGPGPNCRVDGVKLAVPFQRAQLMLAARYGKRRGGADVDGDPMDTEVFDVEINAYWEQTSNVDQFTLDLYEPGSSTAPRINTSTAPSRVFAVPLPPGARLNHNWNDTYGVRIGGDYNLLPGVLALRGGVGYETAAVPTSTMSIDYWPVQRVVLHLGATVRLGHFDIHLAYAHSFNQNVTVPVGKGDVRQVVVFNDAGGLDTQGNSGWPVNEGKYTSRVDILAMGVVYNF